MAEPPEVRIGTADREKALAVLSEHFSAGRLSIAEFDERSSQIAKAITRGELDSIFADLPAQQDDSTPQPAKSKTAVGAMLDDWPERVMAVIPIAAVILFFITNSWLWFLAIPAAGALLYGSKRL
ncbi:DUF1707 domain-containing protein [Skermania sp. ID1734]|uniref:DUF1707 SHOCT-like domain-containing protein n=1 Tax=Skermania sp. ID1734 TaxID=2597516 RepID=UPI00117D334D|nr:DUF1707 domain-containing protein [Skermania sp. ID1734]TSD97387.1 DUF1707 domain-containing protein [Skermania sp. ID1734]